MPRILHQQLSARLVATVRKPGLHLDGHGLYLQVSESNSTARPKPKALSKSWTLRYRFNGKVREMGLGSLRSLTLAEAREEAKRCRGLLLRGVDPLGAREERRQQQVLELAKAITFGECAERFIAAHSKGWKNAKHGKQWASTIETHAEKLLSLPVQAIDTALVVKVLEPIWTKKPETASRLRARIERVLAWAATRDFRPKGDNPARWKGHLDTLLPRLDKAKRVKHHPALPFREIGSFMEELKEHEALAARALEFAILTAARTGEVIGAKWDEINFTSAIWTIPAERMKAHREHRVPLSPQAVKLLRSLDREGDLIFPISNMAMLALLERMKRGDITVHGFRSTFRDWASETTGYSREVCEMALAHTIGDKAEAAYRRGDLFEKRRNLMSEWSRFCALPSKPKGEVVSLKGRA